jgi:hypothetical protein
MRLRAEIPLLLLAAMTLPAQSLVEYSITTAGAASAAAGMSGLGKATAGVMQNAAGTLEVAHQAAATGAKAKSTTPAGRSGNAILLFDTAASAVKLSPPPDPASVKIGMTAQEALAKFGPPGMKLSSADGSHLAETWSYGSDPNTVTLTLRDGKVAEVSSPPRERADNDQAVVVIVP